MLARIFNKQPRWVHAAGFKIMYNHPLDQDAPQLWETLMNMSNLSVIHLRRRNLLRAFVSWKIAHEHQYWFRARRDPGLPLNQRKSSLDEEEVRAWFRTSTRWREGFEQQFRHHPTLDIYYEDLVENRERELERVMAFLGVTPFKMRTHLTRQNPEPLKELVSNYRDLKASFANTEWAGFFED